MEGKHEEHNKQRLVEMRTHSVRENNIADRNCNDRNIPCFTGCQLDSGCKRKRIGGDIVNSDIPCGIAGGKKMSEVVIVSIISLVGTLFGTFGGIMTTNKLVGYRLEQLEKKVEKHNNVVERVFHLEDNDRLLDEKISVANHRIADLEEKTK